MSAGAFHVAELIRMAGSAEERARILLRVPDSIMLQMTDELQRACEETQFELGRAFVDVRVAMLCAMREPDGELPAARAEESIFYRGLMRSLAGVRP